MTSAYAATLNKAIAELQRLADCDDPTAVFYGVGEMLNIASGGPLRRHLIDARAHAANELVRKYGSQVAAAEHLGVSQGVVSRICKRD